MVQKTEEQTIHRALKFLGRLYGGESPSSEDYNSASELLEPLLDQLNADNVIYIGDKDAIESNIWLPVCRLLAIELSNDFGTDAIQTLLTRTRADNLDALQAREYATLRRISANPPTYETLKADYF